MEVEYFQVLHDRLILQHNKKAWDLWHKDVRRQLEKRRRELADVVAAKSALTKTRSGGFPTAVAYFVGNLSAGAMSTSMWRLRFAARRRLHGLDGCGNQIIFDAFTGKPFANERSRRIFWSNLDVLET